MLNTSTHLAHGELYTGSFSGRPEPYRSWTVRVDGRYPEHEKLDCPDSRYFEVTNRGPAELLIATIPDGEVTLTIQPNETVVLREPSRLLVPLGHARAEIREYFSVDVPDDDEVAA